MAGNPVIAAWIAGGLIWGAALIGLGAMSGPTATDHPRAMAHQTPSISAEDTAAAYERALDGDAWGDQDVTPYHDAPYYDAYRPVSGPDS